MAETRRKYKVSKWNILCVFIISQCSKILLNSEQRRLGFFIWKLTAALNFKYANVDPNFKTVWSSSNNIKAVKIVHVVCKRIILNFFQKRTCLYKNSLLLQNSCFRICHDNFQQYFCLSICQYFYWRESTKKKRNQHFYLNFKLIKPWKSFKHYANKRSKSSLEPVSHFWKGQFQSIFLIPFCLVLYVASLYIWLTRIAAKEEQKILPYVLSNCCC